ncbi:MAG: methyltransferase [Polyangiaceae bacterium]
MRSSRVADPKKRSSPRGPAIELSIKEIAGGGDGVAIVETNGERRAVFVRGSVPGDVVRARVDFASRPAHAQVTELLSSSPDRVKPACAYVDRCGGCGWMHIARISQPNFHVSIVRSALPEMWRDANVVAHPSPGGRRTRARLHVRTGHHTRGGAKVGFYQNKSHELVSVDTCVALHPALDRARASLPALFENARGEGEAEIALGQVAAKDELRKPVLDLSWKGELPAAFFSRLDAGVKNGDWQGARISTEGSRVPMTIGDPTPWIHGGDDAPLRLAPGGFAQASEEGNLALSKRVAELARAAIEKRPTEAAVVELYAGAGNFTVLLARFGKVIAVESNAAACESAQENLRSRNLTARVVNADAATYAIPGKTAVVVLDPPRTGAREACEKIVAARARNVVYVSCDPATLGRDLAILERGSYALESIETFEMFPDTSHVETVVSLTRRTK